MQGYALDEAHAQGPTWEKTENPQVYDQTPFAYVHKTPGRNMLGVVGGNEASLIAGNQVDLESDLRRLNLPNTFCPSRKYQPPKEGDKKIVRDNVKTKQTINTTMKHLPVIQMWAYPTVFGPEPLKTEACGTPERY
jgi:hypothetical protein